ncbi:hypothetical protein ACVBEQ_26905 [Nakamurella sp. GG22]
MANDRPVTFNSGTLRTTQQIQPILGWRGMASAVASGLVGHPWRGVYVGTDIDLRCRLQALQVSVGCELVACHRTAAALHGFGVIDDGLLHVTTADGRSLRQRRGVILHQTVPRSASVLRQGLWVTNAADTAIDVACSSREIDVLAVLDAALACRAVTPGDLIDAVDRAHRRRGVIAVRRWAALADGLSESAMESRTRFRVHQASLPAPELQIVVPLAAGGSRRLDLGWRQRRVGLEYDGEDFHSGDGSLGKDRRRHNELTDAGWTVLYATANDVYVRPEPLIDALRRMLA